MGSYQSGRLEQAAKHHSGVVIEVSDLDHANPSARSYLADLFLQVLEVGEATSATGATFSCANAIFAFTLNLPNGMDELVRRGIGFENAPNRNHIAGKVATEIKGILSSAFLSRVGRPILFDPLSGEILGRIIELAIEASIPTAAARLGQPVAGIEVVPGTGMKLMSSLSFLHHLFRSAPAHSGGAIEGRGCPREASSIGCPHRRQDTCRQRFR